MVVVELNAHGPLKLPLIAKVEGKCRIHQRRKEEEEEEEEGELCVGEVMAGIKCGYEKIPSSPI